MKGCFLKKRGICTIPGIVLSETVLSGDPLYQSIGRVLIVIGIYNLLYLLWKEINLDLTLNMVHEHAKMQYRRVSCNATPNFGLLLFYCHLLTSTQTNPFNSVFIVVSFGFCIIKEMKKQDHCMAIQSLDNLCRPQKYHTLFWCP